MHGEINVDQVINEAPDPSTAIGSGSCAFSHNTRIGSSRIETHPC
jgi:hypothetical protein